jgi:hypothetical protein
MKKKKPLRRKKRKKKSFTTLKFSNFLCNSKAIGQKRKCRQTGLQEKNYMHK